MSHNPWWPVTMRIHLSHNLPRYPGIPLWILNPRILVWLVLKVWQTENLAWEGCLQTFFSSFALQLPHKRKGVLESRSKWGRRGFPWQSEVCQALNDLLDRVRGEKLVEVPRFFRNPKPIDATSRPLKHSQSRKLAEQASLPPLKP